MRQLTQCSPRGFGEQGNGSIFLKRNKNIGLMRTQDFTNMSLHINLEYDGCKALNNLLWVSFLVPI